MAFNNYAIKPNKPAFSTIDDDDDISTFMNTRSATYLASDRLPAYSKNNAIIEQEEQRDNILQQIRQVEQRSLDSTKRSLGAIIESEKIGIETAKEMCRQKEQLTNAENKLDDINSTLKDTQKNINGIKSVFSSLKQWWTTPKQSKDKSEDSILPETPKPMEAQLSKNLSEAVEHSENTLEFTKDIHPAMRLRGFEEEEYENPEIVDFRAHTKKVNDQLDNDLSMMSSGLSRLKNLAQGLGTEIEEQNGMLDRITVKADRADITISSQTGQMNRILKR